MFVEVKVLCDVIGWKYEVYVAPETARFELLLEF